jgi:hypothetical protein
VRVLCAQPYGAALLAAGRRRRTLRCAAVDVLAADDAFRRQAQEDLDDVTGAFGHLGGFDAAICQVDGQAWRPSESETSAGSPPSRQRQAGGASGPIPHR